MIVMPAGAGQDYWPTSAGNELEHSDWDWPGVGKDGKAIALESDRSW